jgi:predicted PurR-regulated permease PerM
MQIDTARGLYRLTFVLILAVLVLGAFLSLIGAFLIDIVLAAILAGLLYPLYQRSTVAFGGRQGLAAAVVVVGTVLAAALPLALFVTIVGYEALQVSNGTVAWIGNAAAHPDTVLAMLPRWLVANKAAHTVVTSLTANTAGAVNAVAGYLYRTASAITGSAAWALLDVLVIALAMAEFLRSGPAITARVVERIPVARTEAHAIVGKTLQVGAATLKSVVIGGTIQGFLVGIGFYAAGIGQPLLWGTIAAFASVVPALGAGLVWTPGAIYLMLTGHVLAGVLLLLWGAVVVSMSVNVLLANIVGRGAAIPPFLVFVSTLGGLGAIGPAGILIGPVLVGVLIGVLDLYYAVLRSSQLLSETE